MLRMSTSVARGLRAAVFLAAASATVALAHHGWSSFDTRTAYYATGTVSSVRWGNPHSEVRLRLDGARMPANWSARPLPQGGDEQSYKATMASARPYAGERKELRLVLAGPSWMERWGLDRPLRTGEKIEVVGFLNSAEDAELRPMVFWLANGQGVWQQLTSLPQQPQPAQR